MNCQSIREMLLECDWDAGRRRRMADALAHAEGCKDCRLAMAEYDALRAAAWSELTALEPSAGWERFEQKLMKISAGHEEAPKAPRRTVLPIGLAAAVALAALGWCLYLHRGTTPQPGPSPAAQDITALALSPEQLTERVNVFRQVSEVFNGEASWVMLDRAASDVGLSRRASKPGKLLVIRLTLSRGPSVFSNTDLMILPGASADLTIPGADGQQVHYQLVTSPDDPGRLQLWAEFEGPRTDGQTVAALATDLRPTPGQVTSVGQIATALGGYDLKIGLYPAEMGTRS